MKLPSDTDQVPAERHSPMNRRRLRAPEPSVHEVRTTDGVAIRLLRYRGGARGPVMLVHCIGVSSRMYSLDTVETNLVEYLCDAGFDVWLLDMRLSIELPAAEQASSFDEIANFDFPAAVETILRSSAAPSLQIVAHGVGSQTFSMAMLAGLRGVRSAVCSQVAIHPKAAGLNRLKAYLRAPELLARMGLTTMTVRDVDAPEHAERLFRIGAKLHPIRPGERCDSDVCRRITALYGPLYVHARLNAETHAALPELFGRINLRSFRHLIRNLRSGHVVREDGENIYLQHLERMAVPIAFIHGEANGCLRAESTLTTRDMLAQHNGAALYSWHQIPGYGHVDCIIGKSAARDVFPIIRDHLLETTH